MKRPPFSFTILAVTILLFASLACHVVTDFLEAEPEPYVPETPLPVGPPIEDEPQLPPPTQTEAPLCPGVTDRVLEAAIAFYEQESGDDHGDEPETLYLVTYSISGDQIGEPVFEDVTDDFLALQSDEAGHQGIWEYFTTLIPLNERDALAEYSIVTDGEGNVLAAVTQTIYDPALWVLEVDVSDSADKLNLTYTLIHEYAHLLTLGPDQVTPSVAIFDNPDNDDIYYNEASACPAYFPGEGCSRSDSYINAYFIQFWVDLHEEWQDINLIEDEDSYYEALDDFYYKYEDRFVNDYAATSPEEDIAEAFAFFILSPRPAGDTIAEEKILFFYDYPELVQLRDEITSGICRLNP